MQNIYVKPWCSFIKYIYIFALKSLLPIHFYNCFVYTPTIVDEICILINITKESSRSLKIKL